MYWTKPRHAKWWNETYHIWLINDNNIHSNQITAALYRKMHALGVYIYLFIYLSKETLDHFVGIIITVTISGCA